MKIIYSGFLTLVLALVACTSNGVGFFLAGMGIGGAALTTYCTAGGSGCSSALVSYASLITIQATQDIAVVESGQATVIQIQSIIENLKKALASGQALPGLTPQQQTEVTAITAAANEAITLLEPLLTNAMAVVAPASNAIGAKSLEARPQLAATTVRWKVSASDLAQIAKMKTAIGALK